MGLKSRLKKAVKTGWESAKSNPLKAAAAVMAAPVIGVAGVVGVNKAKHALTAAGEVPELEMADPNALPTPENSAPQIDAAQQKVRKPQGRAATLLAGASGMAENGLQLARRTLMGR
jgi:hypothetical protein